PLLAGLWSVKERSAAPPAWLEVHRYRAFYLGVAAASAIAWFVPTPLIDHRTLSIVLFALLPLNAFVHFYDRILEWYRAKGLPFAVDHGYLVIFVCSTLLLNAFLLMAGGIVSAVYDAILIGGLLIGLALGAVYTGSARRGNLAPFDYTAGATTVLGMFFRHVLAAVRGADGSWFALERNFYRFVVR